MNKICTAGLTSLVENLPLGRSREAHHHQVRKARYVWAWVKADAIPKDRVAFDRKPSKNRRNMQWVDNIRPAG